jgi:hypothetical protein
MGFVIPSSIPPQFYLRLQIKSDKTDAYPNLFQVINILNIGTRRKQFMDIKKGSRLPLRWLLSY